MLCSCGGNAAGRAVTGAATGNKMNTHLYIRFANLGFALWALASLSSVRKSKTMRINSLDHEEEFGIKFSTRIMVNIPGMARPSAVEI